VNAPGLVFLAIGVVLFFVVLELVTAVLPLVIILTVVPERERESVTALLRAADRTHRRRKRGVLRIALAAREVSRKRRGSRP
jgi:heme exporter protein D